MGHDGERRMKVPLSRALYCHDVTANAYITVPSYTDRLQSGNIRDQRKLELYVPRSSLEIVTINIPEALPRSKIMNQLVVIIAER